MYLSVYGLRIASSDFIPGLPHLPNSLEPDVSIWLQSAPPLLGTHRFQRAGFDYSMSDGNSHAGSDAYPGAEMSSSEAWYASGSQDEGGEPSLRIWKLEEEGCFR